MPQPSSLNSYFDIKQQLESIRELGGAKVDFDTFGQATVWMARVYKYRQLLRQQAEAILMVPGLSPSTPWDDLVIRHNKKDRETFVRVEFGVAAKGKITALPEEERVATPLIEPLRAVDEEFLPADAATEDDLMRLARQLKGE